MQHPHFPQPKKIPDRIATATLERAVKKLHWSSLRMIMWREMIREAIRLYTDVDRVIDHVETRSRNPAAVPIMQRMARKEGETEDQWKGWLEEDMDTQREVVLTSLRKVLTKQYKPAKTTLLHVA